MHNLRDIFMVNTMRQVYNSFIFQYVDYCLKVRGRTYPSNFNSVYVIKKKSIRRIFNVQHNEHTNNCFIQLNSLKLFDLLKYKAGLFMYKASMS